MLPCILTACFAITECSSSQEMRRLFRLPLVCWPFHPWREAVMKYPIQAFLLVLFCLQPLFGQGAGELVPASLPGHPRTWHLPEGAIARLGKGFISAYGNHAVDFSSDGRYLAVASSIGVWIYEVATNRCVTLLPTETQLTSVAFSPDGATLAIGLHNHTIALWQVNTGRRTSTLRQDPVYFPIAVFRPMELSCPRGRITARYSYGICQPEQWSPCWSGIRKASER